MISQQHSRQHDEPMCGNKAALRPFALCSLLFALGHANPVPKTDNSIQLIDY